MSEKTYADGYSDETLDLAVKALQEKEERDKQAQLNTSTSTTQSDPSLSSQLVTFALDHITLFRTPDGEGYAKIQHNAHREVHALRSTAFKQWLMRAYDESTGILASKTPVETAIER